MDPSGHGLSVQHLGLVLVGGEGHCQLHLPDHRLQLGRVLPAHHADVSPAGRIGITVLACHAQTQNIYKWQGCLLDIPPGLSK